MDKNFWNTISDELIKELPFSWSKLPKEVEEVYQEAMIHLSISKALEGIDLPDYGDVSVNLSDLKIPSLNIDNQRKITLEDNFEMKFAEDSQASSKKSAWDLIKTESGDSTSTSTQRQMNLELLDEFNRKEPKFIYLLHHTNFEDAFDNEATDFFDRLFEKDPCISLLWLNGVYTNNQTDTAVLEGILRIISRLDAPEFRKYIMPLVKASFNDKHASVQEAAIMVAENWRNKMCLEALESTEFASNWMKSYAESVIGELREELADEIHQEN